MAAVFFIELTALRFRSFHGVYEEEKLLGNEFEVNAVVSYAAGDDTVKHIDETINYVSIYHIIQHRMQEPTPLLETVSQAIANDIINSFSQVQSISISIRKLHPPIASFRGSVGVRYEWKKEQ